MIEFICPCCNTIIEVDDFDCIVDCPNCGQEVSQETAAKVISKNTLQPWQLEIANII
jgi:predicted RNA-binding Zn-ribbon protein involved in translation (DUF1610 family)